MNALQQEIQTGIREELVRAIGRHKWRLWFRDAVVTDVGPEGVTLAVPTDVHLAWMQFTFGDELRAACERLLGPGTEVRMVVSAAQERKRRVRDQLPQRPREWDALLARRRPRPSFENFHTRPSGRFPVLLLRQLLLGGGSERATTVYVYGPRGSGKTHLLDAFGHELGRRSPGALVRFDAQQFTQRYIAALRAKDLDALRGFEVSLTKRRFVLIDDLDELSARRATQQELTRLIDLAAGEGTRFLLAGRRHPRALDGLSDRLLSRLLGGVLLPLQLPEGGDLGALLVRRARAMGTDLPEAVRDAILERTVSTQGAVEILDRWSAASAELGAPLDVSWLGEVAPSVALTARDEVIERVKDAVAGHFGIDRALLECPTKSRQAAYPRRIAMYLVYRACALPLGRLAEAFGLRSHSSVSRAIREVRALREHDAAVEQLVDGLLTKL